MSHVEMRLRVHFDRHPNEPLTCSQLAQRLGLTTESTQFKLSELLAEGFLQRRRSHLCMRPFVYIRADATWPDDARAVLIANMQRMAAEAAQH